MNLFQFICSLLIGFCLLVAIVHFLSVRWNAPCDECDAHLVRNVGRTFEEEKVKKEEYNRKYGVPNSEKVIDEDDSESDSDISDSESDSDISEDDD